ncbi:hypothetical protein [Rhodoferax sp.]|uniref:hypothetical protein n=1 Tax=Rhodoferax sp. TaxID=50421 RepID=UPI00374C9AE2
MSHSINEINKLQKQVILEFSEFDAATYLHAHMDTGPGYCMEESFVIACGRFQRILENQRSNLSGKFTEADIQMLLALSGGAMFSPQDVENLAGEVSVHGGVSEESDAIQQRNMLSRRISALSYVERLVLVDAVEQAWTLAPLQGMSIKDFFLSLDIELL